MAGNWWYVRHTFSINKPWNRIFFPLCYHTVLSEENIFRSAQLYAINMQIPICTIWLFTPLQIILPQTLEERFLFCYENFPGIRDRDLFYLVKVGIKDPNSFSSEIKSFLGGTTVKNLPANAGDEGEAGSIPGSRRSPGGGNGNPLQYSCLENPMEEEPGRQQFVGLQTVIHNWACTL